MNRIQSSSGVTVCLEIQASRSRTSYLRSLLTPKCGCRNPPPRGHFSFRPSLLMFVVHFSSWIIGSESRVVSSFSALSILDSRGIKIQFGLQLRIFATGSAHLGSLDCADISFLRPMVSSLPGSLLSNAFLSAFYTDGHVAECISMADGHVVTESLRPGPFHSA
jgi:hypothetical protein